MKRAIEIEYYAPELGKIITMLKAGYRLYASNYQKPNIVWIQKRTISNPSKVEKINNKVFEQAIHTGIIKEVDIGYLTFSKYVLTEKNKLMKIQKRDTGWAVAAGLMVATGIAALVAKETAGGLLLIGMGAVALGVALVKGKKGD